MSKIKTLLAFVALTLCGGGWAAEYLLTNATLPQNQSNYDNRTLTLTLPATAAVPSDTVVSVSTIKIGVADHSNSGYASRFPDKITVNGATSAAGTYADDTSIGSNAGWITYTFETSVELKAGTGYAVTCLNASGTMIDDFRFRVADYNGLSTPKIITISSDSRYAPFCTVIGSYESSMPASTFAFTGDANGGSASGFTISGEGGDAAKKTIGPAGTQVPMIYFVSNSDKWHPWANFTAKDTFTLAAYVNTSSCKPAEGKNGIIWSMGNNGGNRVMLVKSSDGKIKLITASGADITNESTAPAFDETAGYHLYTASFSTTDGLKLTVDADTANAKTDSSATTKAADGFQIGSIFEGLQTAKFEVGNNIGVANLIGYDSILSDLQISTLSTTYPAVAMTITTDIHQDTADKEVVLMSATTDGNHFIGVSKGTMTIPAGVEVSVPHIRCINNNATADRATFNVAGTVNVTSESTNPNVWADRLSYKGVLFGHYHGQGAYNITGTLNAPNTYVELCYTAEAQTLNVDGGTLTTKGIHTNNGQGTVNLSNDGRIALSTSTFMNVPVTVTGGTIAASETATYAKQLTVSSGELALEVGAEKTLTLSGGVSNSGTIAVKTGTVVIPAGSEGAVTVSDGATLMLQVTDAQIATGYTATNVTLPADTDIVFVNAQGEAVEGGSGNALAPAAVVWTGTVDGNWNTPGNWSSGATPTSETIVTIKKDASITMASDSTYKKLFIESTVSFAGTIDLSTMHDIVMSDDATITVNVASGNGKMKGITGGKVIKTGAGYLYISNATNNGTALSGTTIQIDGGTVHLDGGHNGDVNMTNPTFVIGANGALTTYGWTSVSGTLTLESDSDKSVFQNNGGKGGKIKGGPAIVKNGTGTITLLAGSDANFGAIAVNGGRLDFGSDQATTVGSAISGVGAIGVNGTGVVTLNGNSNNGFSGGTVITSGTLKLGNTHALGGQGKTAIVHAGGVLDVNGMENHGVVLTLAGGTLKSEGTAAGTGNVQFRSIALTADSAINASVMAGITNNGHNPTTLDLGGCTLTKTGDGDLLLCNVTIKNPGLIDMQGGSFNRDGRTLTFDLTGVTPGVKKTLVQFPEGTAASIDGMQVSNGDFTLAAEDNLIVINPAPVAKIGDQEFTTIEAALAAATTDQTVTLIRNVTGDLVIPANKKVDAGSHTIGGEIIIATGSELSLVGRETRGISGGGTLIVTSGTLYAKNKSGGYAIDGVTVKTDGGTIRLETGIGGASGNNDATSRNVKFVIGASGTLTNYGWVNFEGKIEIASDSEKSVFNGASFRGAIEVVKSGSGAVTFNLSKANDNDANKFTRLTVNDGSLKLVAAVTVEATESGNAKKRVKYDEATKTYSLEDLEPSVVSVTIKGETTGYPTIEAAIEAAAAADGAVITLADPSSDAPAGFTKLEGGVLKACDYVVISPNAYVSDWQTYVTARQAMPAAEGLVLGVKNATEIYTAYPYAAGKTDGTPRNAAESIHKWIGIMQKLGTKYFVLGGVWFDAQHPEWAANFKKGGAINYDTAIPGIVAKPLLGSTFAEYPSDLYFACHTLEGDAKYVWDSDANEVYLNASEAVSVATLTPQCVVSRMELVPWTYGESTLSYSELIRAYQTKLAAGENNSFSGNGKYITNIDFVKGYNATTGLPDIFETMRERMYSIVNVRTANELYIAPKNTKNPTLADEMTNRAMKENWEVSIPVGHGTPDILAYIDKSTVEKQTGLTKFVMANIPCQTGTLAAFFETGLEPGIAGWMLSNPAGGSLVSINNTFLGQLTNPGIDRRYVGISDEMLDHTLDSYVAGATAGEAWKTAISTYAAKILGPNKETELENRDCAGQLDYVISAIVEEMLFGDPLVAINERDVYVEDNSFTTFYTTKEKTQTTTLRATDRIVFDKAAFSPSTPVDLTAAPTGHRIYFAPSDSLTAWSTAKEIPAGLQVLIGANTSFALYGQSAVKDGVIFSGEGTLTRTNSPDAPVNVTGLVQVYSAVSTPIARSMLFALASANAVLKVKEKLADGMVSGSIGISAMCNDFGDAGATYTATVEGDAPESMKTVVVPEGATKLYLLPSQTADLSAVNQASLSEIKVVLPNSYEDTTIDMTDLFEQSYNADTHILSLNLKESAAPAPEKLSVAMPGGKDEGKIEITIQNPIKGLCYSIVTADSPDGFAEDQIVDESERMQVMYAYPSIPLTLTYDPNKKVQFFKVRVSPSSKYGKPAEAPSAN